MPGELTDVVGAEIIAAAFTNDVKNRTLMRYVNAASRDALVPAPVEGNFAYLQDVDQATLYANGVWETIQLASQLPAPPAQTQGSTGGTLNGPNGGQPGTGIFNNVSSTGAIPIPGAWTTWRAVGVCRVQYAGLTGAQWQLNQRMQIRNGAAMTAQGPTSLSQQFQIGESPFVYVAFHLDGTETEVEFIAQAQDTVDAGGTATFRSAVFSWSLFQVT